MNITEEDTSQMPSMVGGRNHQPANCEILFVGELENIPPLIPVLKAICIKRLAIMAITDRGLKITCEEPSRVVQASAFIDRNLFNKYELKNETTQSVCFRMSDLLTALAILFPERHPTNPENFMDRTQQVLRLKFDSQRDRIKLQVVSGNHQAMAYVRTYDADTLVVFSMSFVNKIIVDASALSDFWKCADTKSPFVELNITEEDNDPAIELCTDSDRGRFENHISHLSEHVEHFECTVPMKNKYEMGAMKSTVRPLILASKVSIRMDSEGLLNMQFLIRLDANMEDLANSRKAVNIQTSPIAVANVPAPTSNSTPQMPSSILSDEVPKCFVEFFVVPTVQDD